MKEVIEGWIARDERLKVYGNKPTRKEYGWDDAPFCVLDYTMFPEQKWEDEPRKVKITIETIE